MVYTLLKKIVSLLICLFYAFGISTVMAAAPDDVILNAGGGDADGNGLRIHIHRGSQIQIIKPNSNGAVKGQLFEDFQIPTTATARNRLDNGIYIRANNRLYGPGHFGFTRSGGSNPNAYSTTGDLSVTPATASSGQIQQTTSKFTLPNTSTLSGNPVVTVVWKYTYPLSFVTAEVTVSIPLLYPVSTSTPVRYYHAIDTFLGGNDNGCGIRYVDSSGRQIVGTYPVINNACPSSTTLPANLDIVESFRERSGKFSNYCVGKWDTFWMYDTTPETACAIGKAKPLSNTISTTNIDTGAAIEYDFTSPGTYTFSYDFVIGSTYVPSYDHLEIRHPGSSTLCPVDIKVLACLSSTVPCPTDQILSSGSLTGNVTVSPTSPAVTSADSSFDVGGNAQIDTVTLQGSSAATYTLGASGLARAPLNGIKCLNTATNVQSCSFIFTNTPCIDKFECMENGLTYNNRVSSPNARNPLYTKVTGIGFDVDAVAVLTSGNQSTAYTGNGVIVELVNDSAGACGLIVVASKTVNFTATDSGRKKVTFTNSDVLSSYPNLRCRVRDTTLNKTGCSSDNFSVRPQFFTVTSTNATSTSPFDATSTPVLKAARDNFNLRAATSDVFYNGIPKVDNTKLVPHLGAAFTGLVTGTFPAATLGASEGTAFQYSEVGHFKFAAKGVYDDTLTSVDSANGDCDNTVSPFDNTGGSGTPKIFGCRFGNTSDTAYFGRFTPDRFQITPGGDATTQATQACNSFTYFGQDSSTSPGFTTPFTMTAVNGANATTQNYVGDYAKFKPAIWNNYQFSATPLPPGSALNESAATPSVTNWDNTPAAWVTGVAKILARHRITRPTAQASSQTITISTRPEEDDHVVSSTQTVLSSSMAYRYGRLAMPPAHGSELLPLQVQIEAQYLSGGNYVRSLGDSCTTIAPASIVMRNYRGNLNACETQISGGPLMNNGVMNMTLSAPKVGTDGKPNTGSVDLEVNLNTAMATEKTCTTSAESAASSGTISWFGGPDPTGRASFGIYKAPVIYMRENF